MPRTFLLCYAVTMFYCTGWLEEARAETTRLLFQQTFREKPGDDWFDSIIGQLGQSGVSFEPSGTDQPVLKVLRTETQGAGSVSVTTELPPEPFCGKRVSVTARLKAEKVSQPPNAWNGVKCMLHIVSPDGDKWLQKDNLVGTWDWQNVEFIAAIPPDATRVQLILGLENVTGTAWFDEITIREVGAMRKSPPVLDPAVTALPVYKGHDKTRLRGAMIGTTVDEKDIRVLGGEWGANHIRWQLLWGGFPNGPADTATVQEYRDWLEREYQRLEQLLPVCEELGMLIVIDLHTPPGGRDQDANMPLFQKKEWQDEFLHTWEVIATRFKGNKAVWAYDLLNEACEGKVADGLMNWQELATAVAKRIRAIDAERAIIVEPAPWGSPDSLDWFEPLEGIDNVVYSVHMYLPHRFTHQGVGNETKPLTYPGEVDGVFWDKDRLRTALEPVFRFQKDYHVHIYLGEFSAIRWAPGNSAYHYLKDCIEIFEESDWDWAYHAFREWEGWSVEHVVPSNATRRAESPTDRQLLLMEYFRLEEKHTIAH
ncbi:MAG: glycoside hydrolase family 5 protein [Planctomycetaceae bacterium]|nr:glycoside hydrolase family 5 protein [Planctomycetaceae bacterium]